MESTSIHGVRRNLKRNKAHLSKQFIIKYFEEVELSRPRFHIVRSMIRVTIDDTKKKEITTAWN